MTGAVTHGPPPGRPGAVGAHGPGPGPGPDAPERAARLERLLGDPFDPANPHGQQALLTADEQRRVPEATERLLADAGLAAEFVPHELGGRLERADELARVLRPLFRRDVGLGYGFGVTSLFAASAVWAAGNGDQRADTARLLLNGGRITILHRELAHANAILRDEFTAGPGQAGGYVLGGRKDVVINADRADAFVMYARTSADGRASHSVLYLDPDRLPPDRVHRLERVETAGMRGCHFSGIAFTDCPVPREALVGTEGDGVLLALRTFQVNRCLIPGVLVAAVDSVLRHAVRASAENRPAGVPGRRWHRVLAGVFADLLACDSMAVTGLRALGMLPDSAHLLAAAVKYTMPDLLREDLEELATALGARGYDRGPLYGGFRKLVRDLPVAGLGHAGTAACQAVLVPQLRTLARTAWFRTPEPPSLLFQPHTPAPPFDYRRLTVAGTGDPLVAALDGAADRLAAHRGAGPVWTALADLAETFVQEVRTLSEECRELPEDQALFTDPTACVLADRYALVLAAAATLGVRQGQDGSGTFLDDPSWAVLALSRIGRRLGVPVPELPDGVTDTVVAEVMGRYRDGRSFDLYAAQLAG